jgi:hypothetical protein
VKKIVGIAAIFVCLAVGAQTNGIFPNRIFVQNNPVCQSTGTDCPGSLGSNAFVSRGRTTQLVTTGLLTTTVSALYQANVSVNCDTSSSATLIATLRWTDTSSTAQSTTAGGTVSCTTLGAGGDSYGSITVPVNAKTGTVISIEVAITGSPNYDIAATVDQLTSD